MPKPTIEPSSKEAKQEDEEKLRKDTVKNNGSTATKSSNYKAQYQQDKRFYKSDTIRESAVAHSSTIPKKDKVKRLEEFLKTIKTEIETEKFPVTKQGFFYTDATLTNLDNNKKEYLPKRIELMYRILKDREFSAEDKLNAIQQFAYQARTSDPKRIKFYSKIISNDIGTYKNMLGNNSTRQESFNENSESRAPRLS